LTKLDEELQDVANVKVWITNEKGNEKENRVEYQCRPIQVCKCSAGIREIRYFCISTLNH